MRLRSIGLLFLLAAFLLAAGCETTTQDRPRESSIPWNRPQSWEGRGPIGSAMPQQP